MNSLFEPHSLDIGEAFTLADRLEFDSLAPAQYIALAPNGSSDVMNTTSEQMDGSELYYVPPALVLFLSLLYGSVSVISIVGNMLVIIVVCRYKSMQTVTNFFIANLSIGDVLIGIFSIPFQFQAALSQRWDLPAFLCPVAPSVKELTLNVSILTLAVISLDRYRAVMHPLRPRCSASVAAAVMAVVWSFSAISAAPTAIAYRIIEVSDGAGGVKPFCQAFFPSLGAVDWGKVYRLYLATIQYFLPMTVLTYAYCRIIHKIWLTKAPGSAVDSRDQIRNRNKRKVIKMLITVVVLFAFCWLPIQTYNLLADIVPSINNYRYINIIWFSSNWLSMSNSCYNPFIYSLLNEKFQHGFRMLFKRCTKRHDIDAGLMEVSNAGSGGRLSTCSREGSLHITRTSCARKGYVTVGHRSPRRQQNGRGRGEGNKTYVRVSFRQPSVAKTTTRAASPVLNNDV